MPAVSKKQRKVTAIAEHHPEALFKRNKGLAKMSKKALHEFAETKEKKLPTKVKRASKDNYAAEFRARKKKYLKEVR
jgi:hypothetical protein